MRISRTAAAVAVLLGSGLLTAAAPTAQRCVNNVCYALNIPAATAASGAGAIFFQISAPTSFSWVALGQGDEMAGANIFVLYAAADGANVTLSPRTTSGHVQPQFDAAAQVTLLAGSGVSNGRMVANVRCDNCARWGGGTMDFSGASAQWIYALGPGSSLMSDDVNANIRQHGYGAAASFSWDLSAAKGGSDVNPFAAQDASASTPTTAGTAATTSTASAGPAGESPSSGSNSSGGSGTPGGETTSTYIDVAFVDPDAYDRASLAHGVLAGVAFLALFPCGGILIRLARFPAVVRVHAALQLLGYVAFCAAAALGVWMATSSPAFAGAHGHPYLGGVVFLLLLAQPLLGWWHHRRHAATGGAAGRTKLTWSHIGLGRAAILLGILNGGFGLHMAEVEGGPAIAYGVLAALVAVVYVASIVVGERRRKRRREESSVADSPRGDGEMQTVDAQVQTETAKYK